MKRIKSASIIIGEPNWVPLEQVLKPDQCADYMYMGRVGEIELYKRRDTRRYLNIGQDGSFYLYLDRSYIEVSEFVALKSVSA